MKHNNKDIYSNELFYEWSNKNHLLLSEKYLIEKYLKIKNKKILEAGTGGGRLAFYLEKLGFSQIVSFDFVPNMIEIAKIRAKAENSKATFLVADACDLSQFHEGSFDYLLYLQQVLSFIENEDDFNTALNEAYRLTKTKGIVIFSFLDYDTRAFNPILSLLVNLMRSLRKEKIRKYHLPWLKFGKKLNLKLFRKNQAVCYWVKKEIIVNKLKQLNFNILEIKNQSTIHDINTKEKGMLYIVCEKV